MKEEKALSKEWICCYKRFVYNRIDGGGALTQIEERPLMAVYRAANWCLIEGTAFLPSI